MAESFKWMRHQGRTPKTRPSSNPGIKAKSTIVSSPMNEPQANAKTLSGGVANKSFGGRRRTRGGRRV
jgi:hypothetical protein